MTFKTHNIIMNWNGQNSWTKNATRHLARTGNGIVLKIAIKKILGTIEGWQECCYRNSNIQERSLWQRHEKSNKFQQLSLHVPRIKSICGDVRWKNKNIKCNDWIFHLLQKRWEKKKTLIIWIVSQSVRHVWQKISGSHIVNLYETSLLYF